MTATPDTATLLDLARAWATESKVENTESLVEDLTKSRAARTAWPKVKKLCPPQVSQHGQKGQSLQT
jgi:hypothetical protein